jgi:mannose-6-phosphate isomerase-like protein (cupin superfamily)
MTQLKLTPHETVEILEETPDLLLVEVTWGSPGKPPPAHFHPAQDEHFSVSEGRLSTRVGGTELVLEPGETLDIPRGTEHQMWNAGPDRVVARWTTRPAGRTGEWFRRLDALVRERDAMPPLPVMAALLTEFDDVFRLTKVPPLLLKGLAPLGRKAAQG